MVSKNVLNAFGLIYSLFSSSFVFISDGSEEFTPVWQWDLERTSSLFGLSGAASSPMPHYACTNEPWNVYCPTCTGRFQCKNELCQICNNLCENFDPGDGCDTCLTANSSLCDPTMRTPLDQNQPCIMWTYRPGICLPRLQLYEGIFAPLATYFFLGFTNGSQPLPPASSPVQASLVVVSASAKWGWLDIFGLMGMCGCDVLSECYQCEFISPDGISVSIGGDGVPMTSVQKGALRGLRRVLFSSTLISGTVQRSMTLQIEGSYTNIVSAMLNMSFQPLQYFNSFRVRHLLLAPTPTKTQVFTHNSRGVVRNSHPLNFFHPISPALVPDRLHRVVPSTVRGPGQHQPTDDGPCVQQCSHYH